MLVTMGGRKTSQKPANMEYDNHAKIGKMRDALTSIASEMQKFQESSAKFNASAVGPLGGFHENEKVLAELVKYKTKINSKRDRIEKLRKNLRTACFVAKTVASAKEDESGSLKQRLTCARTECADLLAKYKNNKQMLNSLSRENDMLRSKLDNVSNFIQLGYRELQNIKQDSIEETSVLAQLKKLIISCGQYYADYQNEREMSLQLKQKNRFLINKICILEYNVESLSEQLGTMKYRNTKLQKENDLTKNRCQKSKLCNEIAVEMKENCNEIEVEMKENFSTDTAGNEITKYKSESGDPRSKLDPETDFDLTPHLSTVKKLLDDQDTLIKDLKLLSKELLNLGIGIGVQFPV